MENREIERENLYIQIAENNKKIAIAESNKEIAIAKFDNEIANRKMKIGDIKDALLLENIEEEIQEENIQRYSFVPKKYDIVVTAKGANVVLSNGIKISASYAKPYKGEIIFVKGTAKDGGVLKSTGKGKNVPLLAKEILKIKNSIDFIPKTGEKAKQDFLKNSLGIDKKIMLDVYLFHIDNNEYEKAIGDFLKELHREIPQSEFITKVKEY